jgi:hypothetical protein
MVDEGRRGVAHRFNAEDLAVAVDDAEFRRSWLIHHTASNRAARCARLSPLFSAITSSSHLDAGACPSAVDSSRVGRSAVALRDAAYNKRRIVFGRPSPTGKARTSQLPQRENRDGDAQTQYPHTGLEAAHLVASWFAHLRDEDGEDCRSGIG